MIVPALSFPLEARRVFWLVMMGATLALFGLRDHIILMRALNPPAKESNV